jgi:hypothetical protein
VVRRLAGGGGNVVKYAGVRLEGVDEWYFFLWFMCRQGDRNRVPDRQQKELWRTELLKCITSTYFPSSSKLGAAVLEIWILFPNMDEPRRVCNQHEERPSLRETFNTYKNNETGRSRPRENSCRAVCCGILVRQQTAPSQRKRYATAGVLRWFSLHITLLLFTLLEPVCYERQRCLCRII